MKLTGQIAKQGLKAFAKKPVLRAGRKVPRIWVVVADNGVARIFRKPDKHLELIGEAVPDETMQARMTNKTVGRVAIGGGNAIHHKYEPHMEQSHQDALQFARDIADWLDNAEAAEAFDRLVLVAAPHMLGDLRTVMSKSVEGRIAAEIDKDLTKMNEIALRKALDEILWF
jgi:protein required for attachment to host cells